MVTLKEYDAVCYLNKVRNCIHPMDDFSHLKMISRMLEIEAAFIGRLALDRKELAMVEIDATGFPKLDEWLNDIKLAFYEYDQIRELRKKLMAPFSQQFLNASSKGIAAEADNVAKTFSSEHLFGAAFKGVTWPQRNFLLKENEEGKVIYLDPIYPGLLMSIHRRSVFQETDFYPDAPSYNSSSSGYYGPTKFIPTVPERAGLKFIGSKLPCIIYTNIESGKIQVLDSSSLFARCGTKTIKSVKLDEHGHRLVCKAYQRNDSEYGHVDYITEDIEVKDLTVPWDRNEIERKFEGLHENLRRAFLEADLHGTDCDFLVNMLPRLNTYLTETLDFLQKSVDAQNSPEEFAEWGGVLAEKTGEIYNGLEDDKLRMIVQLLLAQTAKPVIGEKAPEKPEIALAKQEPSPKDCYCLKCNPPRRKRFGIF